MLCCFFSVFLEVDELEAVELEAEERVEDLFDLPLLLAEELLAGEEFDFLHLESQTLFRGVLEQDKERVELADTEEMCWKMLRTEEVMEMRLKCKPLADEVVKVDEGVFSTEAGDDFDLLLPSF